MKKTSFIGVFFHLMLCGNPFILAYTYIQVIIIQDSR